MSHVEITEPHLLDAIRLTHEELLAVHVDAVERTSAWLDEHPGQHDQEVFVNDGTYDGVWCKTATEIECGTSVCACGAAVLLTPGWSVIDNCPVDPADAIAETRSAICIERTDWVHGIWLTDDRTEVTTWAQVGPVVAFGWLMGTLPDGRGASLRPGRRVRVLTAEQAVEIGLVVAGDPA